MAFWQAARITRAQKLSIETQTKDRVSFLVLRSLSKTSSYEWMTQKDYKYIFLAHTSRLSEFPIKEMAKLREFKITMMPIQYGTSRTVEI